MRRSPRRCGPPSEGPSGRRRTVASARDLADALGVNMHTVLRAYADLRDDGLVEMRRRRGVRVRAGVDGRARLVGLIGEVAVEANKQGVTKAELRRLIEEAM